MGVAVSFEYSQARGLKPRCVAGVERTELEEQHTFGAHGCPSEKFMRRVRAFGRGRTGTISHVARTGSVSGYCARSRQRARTERACCRNEQQRVPRWSLALVPLGFAHRAIAAFQDGGHLSEAGGADS